METLPRISRVCAVCSMALAVAILAAWAFDLPWLRGFGSTTIEMKVITALTFIAAGLAVLSHRVAPRLSDTSAVIVALLGTASLVQYAFDVDLHIDSFLIREEAGAIETTHPGRMAPHTALAFLLFGISKLGLRFRSQWASAVGRIALYGLIAIPLPVLIGYAYTVREFRGVQWASPMALSTAICFGLLATATAGLYRDRWPFVLFQGDTGSAHVARTVVPVALAFMMVFGWLRLYAERTDIFGSTYSSALLALFSIIILAAVVVSVVSRLRRVEATELARSTILRRTIATMDVLGESPLQTEKVSALIVAQAQELAGGDGAFLVVPDRNGIWYREAIGSAAALREQVAMPDGVVGEALRSEELTACRSQGRATDGLLGKIAGAQSIAAVPLRYGGVLLGALAVVSSRADAFGDEECDGLRLIATTAAARMVQAGEFETRGAFLREQSAALTTLRQQFSAFMENIPAAAFIKDRQGHYLYANPFIELMLRVQMQDILGAKDADILPERTAAGLRAGEETMLEDDTVVPITFRLFEDDDAPYWLLLRFPIHDQHDRVFIGGVAVDVTEVKRAEQRVAELNATLEARVTERTAAMERSNRELEAFSYSVSHDLRAPLRAVSGYSRILEDEYAGALDEDGKRYLATIRREAGRMGQLIDDLLAFSRVGRQHLSGAEIDMANLVASVFDEVRRTRPDRDMELMCGELPSAWGDRSMLRQVLVNLIANAAKYAQPEGTIRIEAGGRREDGVNTYWIRDHGVGFDMRYADKLFQVFQRLHSADQFEGTGVGLAIVERVISRHGGRVWAEGTVGEGATFYFSLPVGVRAHPGLSSERNLD